MAQFDRTSTDLPAHRGALARPARAARGSRRRGTVLVLAIWVILILAALALVYARSMRVELIASGNRLAAEQAAAVQRGAEQYVLALADAAEGDAAHVMDAPAEAVAVGDGYFWIVRPSPGDPRAYEFGIADEAAKLNLNAADALDMAELPGMTDELALSIMDWRDDDATLTTGGAESEFYLGLARPYRCKDGPLETLDELRLIRGAAPALLHGADHNRNGAADDLWNAAPRDAAAQAAAADDRGLAPFVTVSTVERNADARNRPRVNINGGPAAPGGPPGPGPAPGGPPPPPGAPPPPPMRGTRGAAQVAEPAPVPQPPQPGPPGQPGQPDPSEAPLRDVLLEELQPQRVEEILARARAAKPYRNVFDFAAKGGLSADELRDVIDRLTTVEGKTIVGRVNVNTAPREVLQCLPGLEVGDADTLISQRGTAGADAAWVLDALPPEKLAECGGMITGRSFQYGADIVAVSGDGRAFRRVRVIVDARQSPPVVVRRHDLTSLGWPLSDDLRAQMRSGQRPQVAARSRRVP
jgi:type II secretory pathway component PulK